MPHESTHDLGRRFEDAACAWLAERGWSIVARNERRGHREIDIIAARGDVVAFIEVKGRRSRRAGHPLEAVTFRKRRDIEQVARRWVHDHQGVLEATQLRFDVIAISSIPDADWWIDHVVDAWVEGE